MSNEKIQSRLRKFLALANDQSTTEHEKIAAFKAAQQLMLDHNLTVKDTEESEFVNPVYTCLRNAGGNLWQGSLLTSLGKINGVFVYKNTGVTGYYLYGKKNDVSSLLAIMGFVSASILQEGLRRYKASKSEKQAYFPKIILLRCDKWIQSINQSFRIA